MRVLLGLTGSVAALKAPQLCATLQAAGCEVQVAATEPSLHFFAIEEVAAMGIPVHRDADEWTPSGYRRGDPVLHIELRRWADLLLVAPLDANTLGKFSLGLSDNLLTCVFRAWDWSRPVVLAPAMNTLMWENPMTRRHLGLLLEAFGDGTLPAAGWPLEEADALFRKHAPGLVLIPPQSKRLACGDVGTGAMAEVDRIAEAAAGWLSQSMAEVGA